MAKRYDVVVLLGGVIIIGLLFAALFLFFLELKAEAECISKGGTYVETSEHSECHL